MGRKEAWEGGVGVDKERCFLGTLAETPLFFGEREKVGRREAWGRRRRMENEQK